MPIPSHFLRAALIAAFAAGLLPAGSDRITSRIDTSRVRVLRGTHHPRALQATDLGPADPDFSIAHGMLLMKPADDIEPFLTALQTPGSPEYHRWLTPEEFGQKFGSTGNDRAKLVAWLESQGLRVDTVARGGQWIGFSGSALQVGKTFRTEFHRYRLNGKVHFANASELSIPLALDQIVGGIHGLDNFGLTPMLRRMKAVPDFTNSKGIHNLAPDDVASIYNLSALYAAGFDGTGQTIAIVGQTNIDLADIRAFRQRFNLPPNDPKVMLFGPDPGTSDNDVPEADLDLEWSGAVARNAQIIYVNSTDVVSSVFYAIDNNLAPVISMSYGGCEAENTPDLRTFAQQANAQGITWVVSSGDSGAAACDFSAATPQASKGRSISFPASIPEVTAIGGTTFNEAGATYWAANNGPNGASAMGYIPETAWNDSVARNELAATGGGASSFYPKPFWQAAPGVPADGARDIPDVSFSASPDHDGYLVQAQGAPAIFGGTSVGTPVFAGLVGLLNHYLVAKSVLSQPGLGNINPVLYRLAQATTGVYHDVTTGDNAEPCAQATPDCVNGSLGYAAGPGYDLATGLGSVDAWQLAKQWNTGVTSTTSLVASPTRAKLSDTVKLTATVTSTGTSRPTGTVLFLSSYNSLGTVSLSAGNTPGTATATLSVPMVRIAEGTGSASVLYAGDSVVAASGASAFVELQIPAAGSLVVPSVDPNPVYQFGNSYQYTVTLQEVAGVATKVTGFTFDGGAVPLTLLPRTTLPAFGFIQFTLANGAGIVPTAGSHVFGFTGQDSGGQVWNQSVTATFLPSSARAISPSILLTSVPSKVFQNPSADPNCQWLQQLTVQEQGGFLTNLTRFSIGTTNMNSQIQRMFGTTRLAPYGVLYGNFCFSSSTVTASKTFTIGGVGEIGTVSSVATATYLPAPVAPAAFSVSPNGFAFAAPDSTQFRSAPVDLTFTGGDTVWTASILPANITSRWLTVTPNGGSGPGRVMVQASSAGLSSGVYRAYVTFQTTNAFPQAINVPVTLVVGPSGSVSTSGIANAASFAATGAPGAEMRVLGLNLAPSSAQAGRIPLPLSLMGVSATVNGISAPLYSVAPGQINFQVPYETAPGTAVLAINNNGQIGWQEFPVAIAAPGVFASQTGFLSPSATAHPGDTVAMYITGAGDLTPTVATGDGLFSPFPGPLNQIPHPRLPVSVTVAGTQATVVFRGITQGTAGVTQVNFTVPDGVLPGVQPVVASVGGLSGPPVNLTILSK